MKHRSDWRFSFILNIIFALYNGVLGFLSHSWWLIALGAYYVVLSVMRLGVLALKSSGRSYGRFAMRFSGVMIFALSVVLCGIVYMTIYHDVATEYHEIAMITIALYAFIKITLAVMGFLKARRGDSPYVKTLRSIALADGVVSIYSLQRSMLVSFGEMAAKDIAIFNTASGIGMCLIVVGIGIYLMIGKEQKMAKSKIVKKIEKISEGVTRGYKKIEKGVVDGYTKIEDKFVDQYLTRDGETVEEAKKRLKEGKNI